MVDDDERRPFTASVGSLEPAILTHAQLARRIRRLESGAEQSDQAREYLAALRAEYDRRSVVMLARGRGFEPDHES